MKMIEKSVKILSNLEISDSKTFDKFSKNLHAIKASKVFQGKFLNLCNF